jgi:beta-galactosidase
LRLDEGRHGTLEYEAAGGTPSGSYEDGKTAAVEHRLGKGRTLLVGTFPGGGGYFRHHSPGTRNFFASLLDWAGVTQTVRLKDPGIQARLHSGDGGVYLWVVNQARESRHVAVTLDEKLGPFTTATDLWQKKPVHLKGRVLEAQLGDRNVAVIRLEVASR